MLNLYNAQIQNLYIHKVGNKSRREGIISNEEPTQLSDEMTPLFKEYFFKPFREKEEVYYKFNHDTDLEFNDLFASCRDIFSGEGNIGMMQFSQNIARHLYYQSGHPHIKPGELYICHITNVILDNERTDAIGIFKSEVKQDFIKFAEQNRHLDIILTQGINLSKLDKGALIINTEAADGYKVLSIDQNRYDTKYWLDNFLSVIEFEDSRFQTKKYLKFCQDFAKDVINPAEDKKEEVMFMNRAINHFASNDDFEESAFINEVLENPDLIPAFQSFKTSNAPKYSIQDLTTFPINNEAVSESRKKFKSVIELDTNVTIKMDFVSQQKADEVVEKGWDPEREMYFYLVYFNKENK